MASSRPWPFDDDDDRPSGSVRPLSQADLQAILAHLGDDPDELLAGTGADRPVVAVRVRASVGRPGGSAQARWRRLRAAEWAAWTRTLPWRVAAILGIGAAGGVLGSLLAPRLGLVLGGLAAMAAGWGLRFRPSPDAVAWRRGAAGERRTARLLGPLERHGWAVLHDLAVPGSRANIDHLVIGPGGVFVIDSKQYRGRLQLDPSGRLWHGRYPLAPTLRAVSFEADQAAQVLPDPGVAVVPIVAVHGAQVPWGKVVIDGVPVVAARRLPSMLRAAPGGAGARAGRRPGRPGPGPLPRRRLTRNATGPQTVRPNSSSRPFLPNRMRTWEAAVAASSRPWSWRDRGRAFGACCFAGKLRSPAGLAPGQPWRGRVGPYASPYAERSRTPRGSGRRVRAGHAPSWGQSAARAAADWPPSGEWSGRAGWCASRD